MWLVEAFGDRLLFPLRFPIGATEPCEGPLDARLTLGRMRHTLGDPHPWGPLFPDATIGLNACVCCQGSVGRQRPDPS